MASEPWPANITSYTHKDGRPCLLSGDGETWRYWIHHGPVGGLVCFQPHPSPEDRHVMMTPDCMCIVHDTCLVHGTPIKITADEVAEKFSTGYDADRGEFGMPTIGKEGDMFTGPDWDTDLAKTEFTKAGPQPPMLKFAEQMRDAVIETKPRRNGKETWTTKITPGMVTIESSEGMGVQVDAVTPEARAILDAMPWILKSFLEKNAQYARAQSGHDLGLKGVIPDINRKTSALITRIWDGQQEMPGDDVEELIGDLIGHLLLMLGKMKMEG